MKVNTRSLKTLLVLVLAIAIWPMISTLKPKSVQMEESRSSLAVSAVSISTTNFAVPIVIAASFTRITDDDNNLIIGDNNEPEGTREKIYALIGDMPGIHFREICRQLEKEIGVVQYHVYVLKKFNLITSLRDGRYSRHFVKDSMLDVKAQRIISSWHRPVERKILSDVFQSEGRGMDTKQFSASCGVTMQAINWHLDRLEKNELVMVGENKKILLPQATRDKMADLLEFQIIEIAS
ncbi:hypothetical protein GF325_14640 [Candidatus Bathyarchaeota archaeon]|nr:hypothetical protein [Candidatus Bathyarchaeota archaeon]